MDPVILGSIVGAIGAILGGFLGAWFIALRDDRRRQADHKAAVRAVLVELMGNVVVFDACLQAGSARTLAVSRDAYVSLLTPLYSGQMPGALATELGRAYGRLVLVESAGETVRFELMQQAAPLCREAADHLMEYATSTLKMKFPGGPGLMEG